MRVESAPDTVLEPFAVRADSGVLLQHAAQLSQLSGLLLRELEQSRPAVREGSAEDLAARLVQRSNHRAVHVYASSADAPHESATPLLCQLHTQLLTRRGSLRLLFSTELLADGESMERLHGLAERGAQIRLSPASLPNMAVYDGAVALIAGSRGRGRQLDVVQHPEYTGTLQALHGALWQQAVELSELSGTQVSWEQDSTMDRAVGMLVRGYTDEHAARELGLSLRTYRRYVADLMSRLAATSRFQAGVRAARAGVA